MEREQKNNLVVAILNIVGVIFLLIAVGWSIRIYNRDRYDEIMMVIIFAGASILFFFYAQVLDNLVIQTIYLKRIYKNTQKAESVHTEPEQV